MRLLAELGQAIAALRQGLPAGLEPEAQEMWLDRNRPGWADALPLRLSEPAREAILRPALRLLGTALSRDEAPLQRLLRRRADGGGWLGAVKLCAGALLPAEMAPFAPPGKILRLVSDQGLMLRASPEPGGWHLDPIGRSLAAMPPTEALVFTVTLDGRALGEVVLDPGLAEPELAPGFWAAGRSAGSEADELYPLARPRCRGPQLWLLAPPGLVPLAGEGVALRGDEPAPEGRLWQIEGRGQITLGAADFEIATGAEDIEDAAPRMAIMGRLLPRWRAKCRLPVYCGPWSVLGAHRGAPLRDLCAPQPRLPHVVPPHRQCPSS